MSVRTFSRSFNGGEVTPEFWGQLGDAKYQTGLALCRNFIPLPHGPVTTRMGTQFVAQAKQSAPVCLIPFEFSSSQTYVLQFGAGYIRFHTLGATVESSPGAPYEVATPYAQADLFDLHFVQSADVLTITHTNYAPMELRRLGALSWTLTPISFAPTIATPITYTGTATTASSPSGLRNYAYVITAKNAAGEESFQSYPLILSNNLLQTGAYNTISWVPVTGAQRYCVYLQSNGLYGYIGETDGLTFKDDNITPDLSRTPPLANNPFSAAGDYPGAVSYFEQRRVFAGTTNKPQNLWMTKSGTESNLNYSLPTRDDDSISFRVAARQVNTILHVVPLATLVLLTSNAEWRVTSVNTDAITPSSVSVKPQSYIGSSNVQPVVVNNTILYCAARGGHMREMAYNWQAQGYVTGDLSLRAPHLFDGLTVVDMAYCKAPYPILWAVSSNGKLLGLTYVPEQQIGAWHQHDTGNGDLFQSVCAVTEGQEDVVYAAVQRTVLGASRVYIERFATRQFGATANAVCVDAALTYSGAPATTISGLAHLEGRTVSILADGAVHPQRVVAGGQVVLDNPASIVTVGLPIVADLQTLPMAVEMMGMGQGRPKNVDRVWLRLVRSSGVKAGPDFDSLREIKQRRNEPMGTPPAPITDEVQLDLTPTWQTAGQVCVRQTAPLPCTIVSMTTEVTLGG
jgi:hypothetical protein